LSSEGISRIAKQDLSVADRFSNLHSTNC